MRRTWLVLAAAALMVAPPALARRHAGRPAVTHGWTQVGPHRIFYREAGPRGAPVLVLLHGFPTSSFMYRELIPLLAARYRVIAPDYPGAGYSDAPAVGTFPYSFDSVAEVMRGFLAARGVDRYTLYMQDFGGPVGFRVAAAAPERVEALIVQNANIYEAGLSPAMQAVRPLWGKRTREATATLDGFLTPQGAKDQIVAGAANEAHISPDAWTHAQWMLADPRRHAAQLEMLHDYGSNPARYAAWQSYLRERRPRLLVLWGRGDPMFVEAGARAFARDVPDARIRMLDAGHFAIEEQPQAIADEILAFLTATRQRQRNAGPRSPVSR